VENFSRPRDPRECLGLSDFNGLDTRLSHPIETELQTFKLISLVGNDLRDGGLKFSPAPLFASPNCTTAHNWKKATVSRNPLIDW
jgi:hypothetical protein